MTAAAEKTAPATKPEAKEKPEKPEKPAKAPAEAKEKGEGAAPAEHVQITVPKSKEEMYRKISQRLNGKVQEYFAPVAERVKAQKGMEIKLRQVFGDQDARDLTVLIWNDLFDILLQPAENGEICEGSVGIPGGFGSLQLTTAGATTKKTPQGQTVEVQKRWRVKYAPGKLVDEKLDVLAPPPPDEEDAGPTAGSETQAAAPAAPVATAAAPAAAPAATK